MQNLKKNNLERLAYIKYLHKVGSEKSASNEAISFTAILNFHDAIDWFMILACVEKGITDEVVNKLLNTKPKATQKKLDSLYLMDYFKLIPELKHQIKIKKINDLRNNLKHKFIIPSKQDILESLESSTDFLIDNTNEIFKLDFNKISLIDLINNLELKILLKNAVELKEKNEKEDCLIQLSRAFYELLQLDRGYLRKEKKFSYMDIYSIPHLHIPQTSKIPEIITLQRYIRSIVDSYNRNFQELNDSMKVFALGIDYRQYLKFKSIIPATNIKRSDGEYVTLKPRNIENINIDDLDFCISFLFECTLEVEKFKL